MEWDYILIVRYFLERFIYFGCNIIKAEKGVKAYQTEIKKLTSETTDPLKTQFITAPCGLRNWFRSDPHDFMICYDEILDSLS